MPNNKNRKRSIQVKFFVDERKLGLIKTKMTQHRNCMQRLRYYRTKWEKNHEQRYVRSL